MALVLLLNVRHFWQRRAEVDTFSFRVGAKPVTQGPSTALAFARFGRDNKLLERVGMDLTAKDAKKIREGR